MKGKNSYKRISIRSKPEQFPLVFNHCAWHAFRFVADNAEEGEEEEMAEMMENLYEALLHSVDDVNL